MAISYKNNYNDTKPFSDVCFQVALATTTEQTLTIPGTANTKYQAVFSYNEISNVFVTKNGTSAVPANGSTTTVPYNQFRPKKMYVDGADVIHLVTPDSGNTYVGISLMQLSNY